MIVDSSALIAIVRNEDAGRRCLDTLLAAPARRLSAANLLEAYMVIDGAHDPALSEKLDTIIAALRLAVEPVTAAQITIAREAFRRYGKGSGHPARLNYGDCFAYALAHERGEPLLFVGDDFTRTDIVPATGR